MTLVDPLTRLVSDCVSLTFEFLSPKDVLQCSRVSRRWRKYTHSWTEGVGFRVHCCPILFDGEEVDRVAYYKKYAQRDTNLLTGRPTSVKRLGWCKEGPVQVGRYTVWVEEDEHKLCWQKRPSGSKLDDSDSGDSHNIMDLQFPLHRGVTLCHLNAHGQLLASNSFSVATIYDLSGAENAENPDDQQSDQYKVLRWEIPAYWFSLEHHSKVLGASHIFTVDNRGTGQALAAQNLRTGKLEYRVRYPATDEYAPGEAKNENDQSVDVWPCSPGGPELITLRNGREILLQIQWLRPDGSTCMVNVIDGATGARTQRIRCAGSGHKTLEALPQRHRNGEVVHSFRVVSAVRIRKCRKDYPRPPLLVVIQSFAYTERLDSTSECTFQSVGFDTFLLPEGVGNVGLHPASRIGFTISNALTSSPLGVFHLSQSHDAGTKAEIDNLMEEVQFEIFEGAVTRYFRVSGLRDIENLWEPGDKWPVELKTLSDGRLMVSAMRHRNVSILDFE